MVSVGQPLGVAVTLPQRGGGWVSESCGPERAFSRAAAARRSINLVQPFALAILPLLTQRAHLHRSLGVRPGSEKSILSFAKIF